MGEVLLSLPMRRISWWNEREGELGGAKAVSFLCSRSSERLWACASSRGECRGQFPGLPASWTHYLLFHGAGSEIVSPGLENPGESESLGPCSRVPEEVPLDGV